MNLVGGYGSDSDEEQAQPLPTPPVALKPVQQQARAIPSAQQAQTARKVKRLDISFLPPEIQAALARGDSTRDSDDEDVNIPAVSRTGRASTVEDSSSTKSKLLGMLPAPKAKEEPKLTNSGPAAAEVKNSVVGSSASSVTAPPSKFVFGFTSSETTRSSAKPVSSSSSVTQQRSTEEDDNHDDAAPDLPWMESGAKKMKEDRALPFAMGLTAPAKVSAASSSSASFVNAPTRLVAPAPAVQQQTYEEYMRQQEQADMPQSSAADEQSALRKRKEREFELQLMSGDLTGLDQSAAVKDIAVQHQWNEMAYTEQQQRHEEVQRGFGIGSNKMLSQVTKQQNRKHQLSSLAIKAAETELAMLDKRGARNMTKSETQGKYGW